MISFAELEGLLEQSQGGIDPDIRRFALALTKVLNDLDDTLLEQDLPEGERRAIQRMVVAALECHVRGLPPPSPEVKFWMTMLDPAVVLPVDSAAQ